MQPQSHKLNVLALPWPTDWADLFGTQGEERPLIVEIGFGYGQMLFHLARQFPGANIVGVEVANRPITAVEKQLQDERIANVRVVYGHAETFLHHLLTPASAAQIHVNFPDPWFKSGHAHRRVMQRPTVDAITSRLQPGGMFYLATDIDEYAEMSHELLAATPGLTNQFSTPWANEIDNRITTKYEAKALREGRTNKYFAYQRNNTPAPDVPVIEDLAMPNIVFESDTHPRDLVPAFEKVSESFPEDDIHIAVLDAYDNRDVVLFEVFVKEPTIEQHAGFIVTPRRNKPNEYTLRLASFGHPRPTEGMHRAAAVIDAIIQGGVQGYVAVHRTIRE